MSPRRIHGPHCAACVSFKPARIRLENGAELPYAGGLADCEKRGISQYPYKAHNCGDFGEKK